VLAGHVHLLLPLAHQGHLDVAGLGHPAGPVEEGLGIEIAMQVAVEPLQQVEGEGS
jgi:hypothetical protein